MKFFIPGCENDPSRNEEVCTSIMSFAASNLGWDIGDRKLHRLLYIDKTGQREQLDAEVGKVSNDNGELVYAILEADRAFLICTWTNGVNSGYPMIVHKKEVLSHWYFD